MCFLWGMKRVFISQETAFFIISAVKTSSLTLFHLHFCMFYVTYMNFNQITKAVLCDHFSDLLCATLHVTQNWRSEHTGFLRDITQRWLEQLSYAVDCVASAWNHQPGDNISYSSRSIFFFLDTSTKLSLDVKYSLYLIHRRTFESSESKHKGIWDKQKRKETDKKWKHAKRMLTMYGTQILSYLQCSRKKAWFSTDCHALNEMNCTLNCRKVTSTVYLTFQFYNNNISIKLIIQNSPSNDRLYLRKFNTIYFMQSDFLLYSSVNQYRKCIKILRKGQH
jgi:hypothetical protein